MSAYNDEYESDQHFCIDHVEDEILKSRLSADAIMGPCDFCGLGENQTANLAALARMTSAAAKLNCVLHTETDTIDNFTVNTHLGDEPILTLIQDAFDGIADHLAESLLEVLAVPEGWYEMTEISGEYAPEIWSDFIDKLHHKTRLALPRPSPEDYSRFTPAHDVHRTLSELVEVSNNDLGLIEVLEIGESIFRARAIGEGRTELQEIKDDPASHLGPAPSSKSAAGRLNPQGVSMFYGAFQALTAAAEVLRHSPYDDVVIGEFKVAKRLRIINLAKEIPPLSDFHENAYRAREQSHFIAQLRSELLRAVPLDGNQVVSYAPTQLVSEFFRWSSPVRLDGIVYPSTASDDSQNLLLFFDAEDEAIAAHDSNSERDEDVWLTIHPSKVKAYTGKRSYELDYLVVRDRVRWWN